MSLNENIQNQAYPSIIPAPLLLPNRITHILPNNDMIHQTHPNV